MLKTKDDIILAVGVALPLIFMIVLGAFLIG